jgi:hypothetical protein
MRMISISRMSAVGGQQMAEEEFMRLKSLRTESASGEDFASTGSFVTRCRPRDTKQVSYRDILAML